MHYSGNTVYYSQSRHYTQHAKALYNLNNIVPIQNSEDWEKFLPEVAEFKRIGIGLRHRGKTHRD